MLGETGYAKVAVITRTRNRSLLLRRALDDVLSQTFDDFVVVVVNDAGDRESVESVVASFADRAADRVHVVHNATSNGMEAASNIGINASKSTYVAIHDDDDTWAPTFLADTVAYLSESADHGVAVRTEVVFERIEGETVSVERRELLAADRHLITLADTLSRGYAPPISLLYRREVLDTVGLYDETLPVLGDWDFVLRFLRRYTIGFLDGEPLAFWHHRPHSDGDDGNSVFIAHKDHSSYEVAIRERYLRDDLDSNGGLGALLYLTNLLQRDSVSRADHLSLVVAHFERLIAEHDTSETARLARLDGKLTELNRNLVSQNNRMVAQFDTLAGQVRLLEDLIRSQAPRARLARYRRGIADLLSHRGADGVASRTGVDAERHGR